MRNLNMLVCMCIAAWFIKIGPVHGHTRDSIPTICRGRIWAHTVAASALHNLVLVLRPRKTSVGNPRIWEAETPRVAANLII
jgi:hypothetical protein